MNIERAPRNLSHRNSFNVNMFFLFQDYNKILVAIKCANQNINIVDMLNGVLNTGSGKRNGGT